MAGDIQSMGFDVAMDEHGAAFDFFTEHVRSLESLGEAAKQRYALLGFVQYRHGLLCQKLSIQWKRQMQIAHTVDPVIEAVAGFIFERAVLTMNRHNQRLEHTYPFLR
ncbi:hypothetical protein D3C76_1563330 [compost metagenome]